MRAGVLAWAATVLLTLWMAVPAEAVQQLAISPDGSSAYTTAFGGIAALHRDPATGALSYLATYPGENGDVVVSPDGRSVYGGRVGGPTSWWGAGLFAYRRAPDGGLTPLSVQGGESSQQPGEQLLLSPGGDRLYVAGREVHGLRTYLRAADGSLALQGTNPLPGEGEAAVTPITADGAGRLYVAREGDVTMFTPTAGGFERGATTGCTGPCPTYDLTLAPEGDALYGGPDVPHLWARNAGTGALETGGGAPWDYTWNGYADRSAHMVAGPAGRVYVLTRNALYQFVRRDGRLEAERSYQDGRNGWQGVATANSLTFSPDFRHLYVAGGSVEGRPAIVTARRDPVTGDLSFGSALVKPLPTTLGMRIDGGAEYTRSRDVTLSFDRLPPGLPGFNQVRVSNDGGFRDWRLLDNSASLTHDWRLATTGPERLPKTVYAASPLGLISQASIVLDETTPAVVSARRAHASKRRDRVRVRARDRVSGVSRIQVTTSRRKPGKWRRYSSRARYPVRRHTIFVRVRDRAGNRSRWRRVPVARGRRR